MGNYVNDRIILVLQDERQKLAAGVSLPIPELCRVPSVGEDGAIDTVQA